MPVGGENDWAGIEGRRQIPLIHKTWPFFRFVNSPRNSPLLLVLSSIAFPQSWITDLIKSD